MGIIELYGNTDRQQDQYLFNILKRNMSPLEQKKEINNFVRYINQHIKKLCAANDLPTDVSTYWARHSFVTNSVKKGATMEFIQDALGHKDLKTTQDYFDGFDDETKKEFAEQLMDFD